MPRKKQAKALAAIQEDDELVAEEQPTSSRPVNQQLAELLEELEQQGARPSLSTVLHRFSSNIEQHFLDRRCTSCCSPGALAGTAGPGRGGEQGAHERIRGAAGQAAEAGE